MQNTTASNLSRAAPAEVSSLAGHTGTSRSDRLGLSDREVLALIEFLKTLTEYGEDEYQYHFTGHRPQG